MSKMPRVQKGVSWRQVGAVADLDGDGLDDLVAYTTSEPGMPLVVLENLGRLPGTPARMRPR